MDKVRWAITVSVILMVIVGFYFYFKPFNFLKTGIDKDSLAKCLTQNGAKMYGAFWCPHCISQKKAFGSAWQYIEYIECSTPDGQSETGECIAAGIRGFPTWDFGNGTKKEGELSFDDLAKYGHCTIKPSN